MFQTVIHRAAVGRAAQIGALYDVRTESFLHDSLFRSKIDDDAIDTMELGDTSVELVTSDSIQDKFHKLDIEAELQVSLLAGLVKLSGSGAYLNERKKSARTQSMSLIYKIRTVNEEFMLRQNKGKIDTDLLTTGGKFSATHVVVAIDWGAVCSITCESENTEGKDETIVKGMLKAELEKLKSLVDAKGLARVDYQDVDAEKLNKFTIKCKSDVSSTDKDLPSSVEGALELAKSLPRLVEKTNGGKGVPLLFTLKPLDAVAKICRLQVTLQLSFATIKEDTIKRSAQVLEAITEKKQRLFDLQTDLHALGEYVADDRLATVDSYVNGIEIDLSSFRAKLQDLVTKIRQEVEDVSALEALLNETLSDSSPIAKYESYIRQFQNDINKVNLIKTWKDRGINYLGKNDQFIKDDTHSVYVFYKPKDSTTMTQSEQNEDFFLKCQKTYAQQLGKTFKVVDEAIRPDLWAAKDKKATIKVYVNGVETCSNLFEKEGRDTEMCLIRYSKTAPCQCKPSERAHVKLRCPNAIAGNGQCSGTPTTWKCAKCKQVVEYGLTTSKFYCNCGESEPSRCLFRCNEKVHGINYTSFPDDFLRVDLCSLRAMRETNILILGETGVGKSTWINGIANYLCFATLEEAREAEDFHVLIPSQFTFTDKGKSVEIKVGKQNDNEILQAGHSATQETRSYVFHIGEQKIRLIDTPGIGDSRGIEQDRENFDNILSYLSYYDEIHAVCILLKPNNSRLTAMFRFCIQELLVRLHTSAKNNIVFCFTNARATFYHPGDTLPSLNRMLVDKKIGITANPNNYFCFDNEPFRFLACLDSGIEFSPGDIQTYAASWDKAVDAANKLFRHINTMVPHKVRNTISMNESRRVIVAMSKPMAAVAKTIQENMQAATDAKEQIDLHNRGMIDLKQSLKFKGVDLITKQLNNPMTVCAHSDCIERVTVGENNIQKINYKQVCHDPCNLKGISLGTPNDYRLRNCACITGTDCDICGHHYNCHMHLEYTLEKVNKEFISDDVRQKIMKKKTEKEQKEEFKKCIDEKIVELQSEESRILHVSAKYGSFLKKNAMIPYNDAVGDYLDMVIKQEEDKAECLRDKLLLQRLQGLRAEYEKEKQILEEALQREEDTTPEEIMQLQQQIFELKHFGKTLKDIFDGISISHSSRNMRFQETAAPIHQRRSNGGVRSTIQAAGARAKKGLYNLMSWPT